MEFSKVIGPLTDPAAHGGRAEDAFHVVIPSIPGFAFSETPHEPVFDPARIAAIEAKLMAASATRGTASRAVIGGRSRR